jgi:hypothetical protein
MRLLPDVVTALLLGIACWIVCMAAYGAAAIFLRPWTRRGPLLSAPAAEEERP